MILNKGIHLLFSGLNSQGSDEEPVYTEYAKIPLDSGALLIMEGATQDDWQVGLPYI